MARGGSVNFHLSRILCLRLSLYLGLKIRCSSCPYPRQRHAIFLLCLDWSLLFSWDLCLYDDCLPSSKQWHDRAVPSFPQVSSPLKISWIGWFLHLPLVLLGLRTVAKDDTGLSVSEAVCGYGERGSPFLESSLEAQSWICHLSATSCATFSASTASTCLVDIRFCFCS